MKGNTLFSEEWCDIVFEGRNKEYGAYTLRRDAGRRYRRVALLLGSIFGVLLTIVGVTGFFVVRAAMEKIAEIEEEVKQLKPLEDEKLKAVSAGRRAVKSDSPNATTETPEMTEEIVVPNLVIGIKGPDEIDIVDENELRNDKDLLHNTDQMDLPLEGAQLLETERVEEMPKFPGGLDALMKFMDQHVIYPAAAINKRLEGDVEVTFIIAPDGNLIEPTIAKSLNKILDEAVLSAVSKMPHWQPGKVNGKAAFVKVCIPVHFQIQ